MHYIIGIIALSLLVSNGFSSEEAEKMPQFNVKSRTTKGYGLYNLFLEYQAFENSHRSKYFHSVGFASKKKRDSLSNLPIKTFVISPSEERSEITAANDIFPFEKKYRDYKITTNQPFGTTRDYFVYEFTPFLTNEYANGDGLMGMLTEFNAFLKSRCKFIDSATHMPPFFYLLKLKKETTANIVVITSSDLTYLNELNYNQAGTISGHSLLIPVKVLSSLPPDWRVIKSRATSIFPWRAGVPLPLTTSRGVWILAAALRWAWQAPDGWCLPEFRTEAASSL